MIAKYAEGCFRLIGKEVVVEDFELLLSEAKTAKLRRARICIHESDQDLIQEMFVILMQDSPKGTYKYTTANSILLLKGSVHYDFNGEERLLSLSSPFMKIPAGLLQTPKVLSEYALLHETHLGPFDKNWRQCS